MPRHKDFNCINKILYDHQKIINMKLKEREGTWKAFIKKFFFNFVFSDHNFDSRIPIVPSRCRNDLAIKSEENNFFFICNLVSIYFESTRVEDLKGKSQIEPNQWALSNGWRTSSFIAHQWRWRNWWLKRIKDSLKSFFVNHSQLRLNTFHDSCWLIFKTFTTLLRT